MRTHLHTQATRIALEDIQVEATLLGHGLLISTTSRYWHTACGFMRSLAGSGMSDLLLSFRRSGWLRQIGSRKCRI